MTKVFTLFMMLFGMFLCLAQAEENNNITICWDNSTSMSDRDLEKDFSVLEKVFTRNLDLEVQLLSFNITVSEKLYSIKNGDWQQLKQDLEQSVYDGAAIYANLKGHIKQPTVYVFTNGRRALPQDLLPLEGKSYLINSCADRDAQFLERTALVNRSRLMDFAAVLPENIKSTSPRKAQDAIPKKQLIQGTVYLDNKPASNVQVTVKGITDSFLTDASGNFSIAAEVGDTLMVKSRESKAIQLVPIEVMAHTDVFIDASVLALEEVIVVEQKRKQEETTVNTAYGPKNSASVGYAVSSIGEEDISTVEVVTDEVLNNRIAGLQVGKKGGEGAEGGLGRAEIRGRNTLNMNPYALLVIDGTPLQRSSKTTDMMTGAYSESISGYDFIDPGNIAEITVLKGLAATNLYGSEGSNGVILITTKTAAGGGNKGAEKKDLALLQNNKYNENEMAQIGADSFMEKALKGITSIGEAYETYRSLKEVNKGNAAFFLDAYTYFRDKDKIIAGRVISNLMESAGLDVASLRMVAYSLSATGDYTNALTIYEEIIKMAPKDVNAYFNRAQAKRESGAYKETIDELIALANGNKYFSVNAQGISKTLDREIKNLVFQHKGQLADANLAPEYLNNNRFKARLVFEWNIAGADFELQFVNPQKRFFNWKHTSAELKERIEDEIKNQYRIEEFEFYGDVAGQWVFNAKYLGPQIQKKEVPLIVKCTLYKNFGYPSQTKEELLVYFTTTNEKKNIKTLLVE